MRLDHTSAVSNGSQARPRKDNRGEEDRHLEWALVCHFVHLLRVEGARGALRALLFGLLDVERRNLLRGRAVDDIGRLEHRAVDECGDAAQEDRDP